MRKNNYIQFPVVAKLIVLLLCLGSGQTVWGFVDEQAPCDTAAWQKCSESLLFQWGSKDRLYRRHDAPSLELSRCDSSEKSGGDFTLTAWRGERVGAEAVLYTRTSLAEPVQVVATFDGQRRMRNGHEMRKPHAMVSASFLRYVWTDDFRGCGNHPTDLPGWGVPDCIDLPLSSVYTKDMECRPIWVSIDVPCALSSGESSFTLKIVGTETQKEYATLKGKLKVLDKQLPEAKDYTFHLDFWQQPYSVARYYKVKPWSDEHLELLRPYMKRLARGGQKVVSAILFYEPWGQQSNDKFEPMVETILQKDGTYRYDYSVFDKWVELMAECGIDEQIDCYSMVPWDMSFRYLDEATGTYKTLKTTTSTEEYKMLWTSFLKSFAKHLHERGWFDKTCIAMDERGMQDMLNAYKVAQEAVPGIKMTLAGNHHEELLPLLHDYCLPIGHPFTKEEVAARRAKGQHSTLYTCCTEDHPNILSNSAPQEAAFLPLYCTLAGQDGYLHWAWLNWTDDPLHDTRFKFFSPGDTYMIYPDNRSSIRWERFLEGVQQSEKLQTLSEAEREALATDYLQTDVSDADAVKKAVDKVEEYLNYIIHGS